MSIPPPAPAEVRIRLEGCGLCASNLPAWEGRPYFRYPLAPGSPGHEGWGIVEAIGDGVSDLAIGDRVAFISHRAYAKHDLAPADATVKLPEALRGQPFPGESLACIMNIFRRSEISAGQTVAIVGIGYIGAALTALAVRAGARVVAISRRSFALELAERMGASAVVPLAELRSTLHQARKAIGPRGCERVIEAVGTQVALDVASELACTRARLVIAGFHGDGQRQINLASWNWRGLDVINAHERDTAQYRRGMLEAVDRATRGDFDPRSLFTHTFPLEEIDLAFETLARRPDGFVKALIDCR